MRHLIFNLRDALCMIKITSERKRYYQVLEHTFAFPTGRFHAQKTITNPVPRGVFQLVVSFSVEC